MLAGTGTESHDKFRKTLPGARCWDRLGWFMTSISRIFSIYGLAGQVGSYSCFKFYIGLVVYQYIELVRVAIAT